MTRHTVLFRFQPEASHDIRSHVLAALADLPALLPAMKSSGLELNISQRDKLHSHVVTVEFDDHVELRKYFNGDRHESFVVSLVRPSINYRVIVSYGFDESVPRIPTSAE